MAYAGARIIAIDVRACVSVSPSVRSPISKIECSNFAKFSEGNNCGSGSFIDCQQCSVLWYCGCRRFVHNVLQAKAMRMLAGAAPGATSDSDIHHCSIN